MNDINAQLDALLNMAGLDDATKKQILREAVARHWPRLPTYSTLKSPVIEEVQKATVGTGVVLTFKEHGLQKAVLMKAGTHYKSQRYEADPAKPTYMIPGGFINLTETKGTLSTPANSTKAEDPRVGAVRETEEELVDNTGKPLLAIDPSRLTPMDTKTLTFPWGERRVVIGFMLELSPGEIQTVKNHVDRLDSD